MIELIFAASLFGSDMLNSYRPRQNDVVVGYRPGGYTLIHKKRGQQWLKSGKRIVIRGDQVSAAATQVVWYKRNGGKVCVAGRDVLLWFHENGTKGPLYAERPSVYGIRRC